MGQIMKPWIRSWPSDEPSQSRGLSSLSQLRVSLRGPTTIVAIGIVIFFILLKVESAMAAMARPYLSVSPPFLNMTPLSDSNASIPLDTRESETLSITVSIWLVALVCFLAFTTATLVSLWPQEEVRIVERIVAIDCTCNGRSHKTKLRSNPGYNILTGGIHGLFLYRTIDERRQHYKSNKIHELIDGELIELTLHDIIPNHSLEKVLKDHLRAIQMRQAVVLCTNTCQENQVEAFRLPYDFTKVFSSFSKNFTGDTPIVVGVAGPFQVDEHFVFLPIATASATLIAGISRIAKAINMGTGVATIVIGSSMGGSSSGRSSPQVYDPPHPCS